ncbi:MAG: HIRAN domain-containing protein, partial [Coriobacteriales bacterium]|nr:HIRAN domain-containing protein [Coriobacteriales bacterium]
WYGLEVTDELKPGKRLKLVAEPDNPYDPKAVAVLCGKSKIGYVPAAYNAMLAQFLHFGYGDFFEARVQSVRMMVYLKDGRKKG